jgi:hypothetical protein
LEKLDIPSKERLIYLGIKIFSGKTLFNNYKKLIDYNLRAFDKHSRKSFTVISLYDLNQYPAARQSFGVSDTKTVCCGPCKSGPITVNFGVSKSKSFERKKNHFNFFISDFYFA